MTNKKNGVYKKCLICGTSFYVRKGRIYSAKYCSNRCRHSAPFSMETRQKISETSKQKFIDNPSLRKIASDNGRRVMKKLNESGEAWRMPKGYHTEDHKKYISDIMRGRKVTWGDKIRNNHWSYSDKRDIVIDKILKSRKSSSYFQSDEFKYKLAEWSMDNVEKMTSHFKRGYILNKITGKFEWYRSSLEARFMMLLNEKSSVVYWTTRHGIHIDYTDYKGKRRRYYPDFVVKFNDGRIDMIETKGWVRDRRLFDEKCRAANQFCEDNNMNYLVIFKNDLDECKY